MSRSITVEKCDNGYIVSTDTVTGTPIKSCHNSLEFALDALLLYFEGRGRSFPHGAAGGYGEVVIIRDKLRSEPESSVPVPVA